MEVKSGSRVMEKDQSEVCFLKGKEEEQRHFRQVNFKSCLGKTLEHTIQCFVDSQENTRKLVQPKWISQIQILSNQNNLQGFWAKKLKSRSIYKSHSLSEIFHLK